MVGLGGQVVWGATLESLEVTSDPVDEWYVTGDDITVRATFDEAVRIQHSPNLKLLIDIGSTRREAALGADAPARQFTFTYRVQDGDNDTDGISIETGAFIDGTFVDQDDRTTVNVATTTLATLAGHKVDTMAPTVAAAPVIISDPGADNTYVAGDRIEFEITFDQDVRVSGNPELILSVGPNGAPPPTGPLSRRATLVRTRPTQLTFRYVVQAGDFDDDGIRIQADALQGGVIEDLRGNPARRELTAMTYADHEVDTLEPAVIGVELTSAPARGDTYGEGEIIEVEVTFDEVVYVSPVVRVILDIGSAQPYAAYVTGSGTPKLTFRYTVQQQDEDDDGISIGPNALVVDGNGRIEDEAGNRYAAVDRRIDPVREQPNHKVNGGFVNPTVTRVTIRSSPPLGQSGFYRLGDVIEVEVDFNVPVYVAEPREGGDDEELRLVLGIGQHSRYAVFAEGNGTTTLIFRYTVQAGDLDEDGISIGPLEVGGLASLVGARVVDGEGNVVNRRFSALPADRSHRVDAVRPAATGVAVTSDPGPDGEYGRGERIVVTVTLNEAVHVVQTADDVLVLLLQIGENTRRARFFAGSGTNQLMFRYTVRTSDRDNDGLTVGPDALVGAVLEDEAGNDWAVADRRLPPLRPTRSNIVAGIRDDDRTPVVMSVGISPPVRSPPDRTYYTLNERIEIEVTFSEVVHVQGAPTLALVVGGLVRAAALLDGSGTSTLRFGYTVQAGDEDQDGVSIGPDALTDGTIVDGAGNEAVRDSDPVPADPTYAVDARPPEIVLEKPKILYPPDPPDVYGLGDSIRVLLEYTEPVYVTSTETNRLRLEISIGELSRQADYVTGSGSSGIEFGYIVQVGDRDDDGISIGPNALRGGTIEDRAGNEWGAADRRIVPLPESGSPRVDAGVAGHQRPSVRSVEIISTPGTYRTGDAIDVAVTFGVRPNRGRVTDATVHVSGQPRLELQIGTESRQATLVDGSGTETLTFRYVVQAGDYDADGISIGAGPASLSGGTIRDASGNDADRGFEGLRVDPDPDKRHKVNAIRPTITRVAIVSTPAANNAYQEGERIEVEIDYSDDVRVVDTEGSLMLELTIGENKPKAALVARRTDARKLVFRYTVRSGDYDADGISIGSDALGDDGQIVDRVGDEVDRAFDPLPNQSGHMVRAEVVLQIPLNLTVGGAPAVLNVYNDILIPRDIRHYRGGYSDPVSDDRNVATARVSNVYRLVITPVAEGTANIVVVAQDAAIALGFVVTVTANAAEVAVLEHALAAMGRGILASAANTIGTRLESVRRQPSTMGGRRIRVLPSAGGGTGQQAHALDAEAGRWGSAVACAPVTPCGANWDNAYGSGAATGAPFDGTDAWQSPRSRGMGRGGSFEMPLIGVNRGTSWALWGAGDFQTFEGEPELARYDGDVSAAYLGVDARGENWLAGAAVGRVQAQADYQFTVDDRTSRGNLETKLTVLSPYVQWPLGERGKMWALAGVGVGEATIKREGRPSPVEPTDLTMRMGLAGLRTEIAEAGNFRFAVRGELGSVQLETKKGETAVHGLAVNAQRARVGVEASFPMVSPTGAEFTPFADVGGRFDGGDGQTGGGIEVAAGVRASSPLVRFEAKARTLALHGADGYAETGASATVIVEPGEQGRGLRLSLAPRWGGADDAMDVFWRQDAGNGLRAFNREMERGWGVASRVDYGVAVAGRRGAAASVRPFGEVDLVDDDNRRMRVGMTYQLDSMDKPLRFELSSERVEQPAGTEHRFLLSAEGRF